MAVILQIIDLVVCQKIHGCGCVADDPAPQKMVCGQIDTYRFLMLFLVLLNLQVCKYVDSTKITSVR
jgi:hypothetical protein